MRAHSADLFDQAQKYLIAYQQEQGPHPILLIDDAEGLTPSVLDVLRRLTCYELDAEDRFSVLLAGTDELLQGLRQPQMTSLRTRISYAHALKPFTLDDTRSYARHHLERADADPKLITDEATRRIFQAAVGFPRNINQLATQALIQAAVAGVDSITGDFMQQQIAAHPLYSTPGGER